MLIKNWATKKVKLLNHNDKMFQGCFFCGRTPCDLHHIYNKYDRDRSDDDYLTVCLCREHHNEIHHNPNGKKDLKLKRLAKKLYELKNGAGEFEKRYKRYDL